MDRLIACFGDQRGVAIVMALIVVVVLTGLVVAFLSVSAMEPQISQNLASTARARMLADAGVEWGFNRLATLPAGQTYDVHWNALLDAGGDLTGGAAPVPGLPAALGTFTVTVRNDVNAADRQITGVAPDPSVVPPRDVNGRVILAATGTVAGASGIGTVNRTVVTVVRRTTVPPINAALAFPGRQAAVNFGTSAFDIQGIDHNMDGTPGPAPAVFGITVSTDFPANEAAVESGLQDNPQNQVRGKSETTGLPTSGADTIRSDDALTTQQVTDFVDGLKSRADIALTTGVGRTFSASDLGSACAASWAGTSCWGTTDQPKIVHVKGDASADHVSVDLSGECHGTGILLIENGRLEVSGNFRWNGPIIVTGNNVGIRYKGAGVREVYGAVILNAVNDAGRNNLEGDLRGNAKVVYSSQALALVQSRLGRRFVTMYSWREQ